MNLWRRSQIFTVGTPFRQVSPRNIATVRDVRNCFKGISLTSIAAGALAAVTSFLLSAKIGIAGSVIGVAIGSVVSAVATQIYQNVLKASGERIQSAAGLNDETPSDQSSEERSQEQPRADESAASATSATAAAATATAATMTGGNVGDDRNAPNATRTMPAIPAPPHASDDRTRMIDTPYQRTPESAERAGGESIGRVVSSYESIGGPSSANIYDRRRATPHAYQVGQVRKRGAMTSMTAHGTDAARSKRIAIIIAIVSSLAAVAITAIIILAITGGNGTDSVVRDWVQTNVPAPPQHKPDDSRDKTGTGDDKTDNDKTGNDKKESTSNNDSDSDSQSSNDSDNGGTSDSGTSSDSTSTNGSTNSGDSGNTGSSGNSGSDSGTTNGNDSSDSNNSNGSTSNGTGSSSTGSNGTGSGSDSDSGGTSNGSDGSTDSGNDSGSSSESGSGTTGSAGTSSSQ